MRNFLLVFGLLSGFATAVAAQAVSANTTRLTCTIQSAKTTYKRGETIVFSAAIRNESDLSVTLIKPISGSELGIFPLAAFQVRRLRGLLPDKQMKRAAAYAYCGNGLGDINSADLVVLKPGQVMDASALPSFGTPKSSFDLYQHLPVGEYEVSFEYSTVAADEPQQPGEDKGPNQAELELQDAFADADRTAATAGFIAEIRAQQQTQAAQRQALLARALSVRLRSNSVRLVITR